MVGSNGLLRIFWPSDAPRTKIPGVVVGWRNSELDLFVVTVLQDVEVYWSTCIMFSGLMARRYPAWIVHYVAEFFTGTVPTLFNECLSYAVSRI